MELKNGFDKGSVSVGALDFERALRFVLQWESASESDDGEEQTVFRRAYGMPLHRVQDLTQAEAQRIYRPHYWEPIHCDAFQYPLALTLFDSAVHLGLARVTVLLERKLGFEPDGGFGPMTLSALKAYISVNSEKALAEALLRRRLSYYENLRAEDGPPLPFLDHWRSRVEDLRREAGLDS